MNARIRQLTTAAGLAVTLLAAAGCGDISRQGKAPAMLIIDALEGASGAQESEFGVPLNSDVQTLIRRTVNGVEVVNPTYFNDLGRATLRIILKDLGNPGATAGPSALNVITVNRYRVSFKRSDGRNVQGVDVPYTFDGAFTATITNTPVEVGFEMVRSQAKREMPLFSLINSGGRIQISTIAEVTFYGQDQAGNDIQTVGLVSVNFADYGDPD